MTDEVATPLEEIAPLPLDVTRTHYVGADSTGWILFTGTVPAFMFGDQKAPEGGVLVKGVGSIETDYVLDGEIVSRPENPSTIAGLVISNVPVGSSVAIDGTTYEDKVDDGTVELSFAIAGTHTVALTCWPYLDATFTVESE